jgi:hypothetical protein
MADSLRMVIGTTLVIGAALTGVLVLRESRLAPEWLRLPEPAPSSSTSLGVPVLPPPPALPPAIAEVPPPPSTTASAEVPPSGADSVASAAYSASPSAPQPAASASAGGARKPGAPGAAQPGEPEVVELPSDFRYSPQGPGNLTFPATTPTASTAAPR